MTQPAAVQNQLTGRVVLAVIVSFFLVVILVNGVFTWLALSSFPGEDTQHAYMQGLHHNEALAAQARQDALGWTASLERTDRIGERAVLAIRFRGRGGVPLEALKVTGELRRPARARDDAPLSFAAKGGGLYEATTDSVPPGAWDFRVAAVGAHDERFSFVDRVILP